MDLKEAQEMSEIDHNAAVPQYIRDFIKQLSVEEMISWLAEREANCSRIMNLKPPGKDRDGWLEDMIYFSSIRSYVADMADAAKRLEEALRKILHWKEHHEFRNGYWDSDDILEYIDSTALAALASLQKEET